VGDGTTSISGLVVLEVLDFPKTNLLTEAGETIGCESAAQVTCIITKTCHY